MFGSLQRIPALHEARVRLAEVPETRTWRKSVDEPFQPSRLESARNQHEWLDRPLGEDVVAVREWALAARIEARMSLQGKYEDSLRVVLHKTLLSQNDFFDAVVKVMSWDCCRLT